MSLEGRLEDLGLPDIFQIISLSKRSGVLTLIRKEGTGRLVFNQGQVIFASSDTRSRLGYTLVKKGIITNEDLEHALRLQRSQGSKKPIGTILIEMGAIDMETFEQELRRHVILVVHDFLKWDSGSFYFDLSPVTEDGIALKVGFNTESLLLEAVRLHDEEERGEVETPHPQPAQRPSASLLETLETTQVAGSPAAVPLRERKDLHLLASMIAEISGPSDSSELTLMILRFASEIMNRAIILLVRKDELVGLGQFGLTFPRGQDVDRVRSLKIPLTIPSVFRDVVHQKTVHKGALSEELWHKYMGDHLGETCPPEVFVAPLVCEGQTIAVLYGDNIPRQEPIPETEGLEAFIKVAGVAFGKALLERKLQGGRPAKS
jgi:hypothetical protein